MGEGTRLLAGMVRHLPRSSRRSAALGAYFNATDDAPRARERAQEALQIASDPRQPLALIATHRFLGELDTAERQFSDAQAHLDVAFPLAEACQAPYEIALCQLALAELAVAQRDSQAARGWIDPARETFERLEANPALTRLHPLDFELARMESRTTYPAGLTGREVEVLQLVARGMTDAEAAEELFISPRTVSQHLRSVYNKLGVNNRAEAAVRAVELGVV